MLPKSYYQKSYLPPSSSIVPRQLCRYSRFRDPGFDTGNQKQTEDNQEKQGHN